ncbi:hypothetical protein CC86DRAFT_411779 [Ophiobolus disseminans]|uniref:MCM3-like winged helix domain-containing protein n=1 Tax=Ophiobolus disseminans TaxID=1469910 RepID=A0A6A6ZJT7_9PLEO|nr:hypothetical protein CC86DRAFT_411779 [Ophiobolus disseminans]
MTPNLLFENKYGFKVRKRNAPSSAKTQSVPGHPSASSRSCREYAVSISDAVKAVKQKTSRHRQALHALQQSANGLANDARIELAINKAISVKIEGDGTESYPLIIDALPSPLGIPALKNPGKRRGYATMTALEKLMHGFHEIDAAEARQKGVRPVIASAVNKVDDSDGDSVGDREYSNDLEDDSWIEHDDSGVYTWMDDEDASPEVNNRMSRASSRTLSPEPEPSTIQTVSPARLLAFERTFHGIIFGLGHEKIDQVAKTINAWLKGQVPFHNGEVMLALRGMEEKGQLRLHDGKVFLPEAYHLVERRR